ncbi:hypothetical protein HK104_002526 [Borealophlyctis nickersoniae]|nr:hypothetical protein HK104_002526 [Borealophlyctis nickersoniae]
MFLKPYLTGDFESESMKVMANNIVIEPGRWNIVYRDESIHGHDKSLAIKDAKQRLDPTHKPLIIFIGDGVSDISAAREADLVFAKRGKDLEKWCQREGVAFTAWDDFSTVLEKVREIVLG